LSPELDLSSTNLHPLMGAVWVWALVPPFRILLGFGIGSISAWGQAFSLELHGIPVDHSEFGSSVAKMKEAESMAPLHEFRQGLLRDYVGWQLGTSCLENAISILWRAYLVSTRELYAGNATKMRGANIDSSQ